jgi:uncharacterized protein YfaS (alpha-2-macroglobulin family)
MVEDNDAGSRGAFSRAWHFLGRLIFLLVGRPSWKPPPWLRFIYGITLGPIVRVVGRGLGWLFERPRVLGAAIVVLVLAVGGFFGFKAWQARQPQPSWATIDVDAPNLTALVPEGEEQEIDPLHLHFSRSVARLDLVEKEVKEGIAMTPPHPGVWRWVDDAHLMFTPTEDWGVNQEHRVQLESNLFVEGVMLKESEVSFTTASFAANLEEARFYQDPKDPTLKKVVATLTFSHPVDARSLEGAVKMSMAKTTGGPFGKGAKEVEFTVRYDAVKGQAHLHSAPLSIPEKDSDFFIEVKKGVRSSRGGNSTDEKMRTQVRVPGIFSYFRVSGTNISLVRNARFEPEQVLVVRMTDGVLEKEVQKNLKVYVLPRDRPAHQGQKKRMNHRWNNPAEIGPEILDASLQLKLDPVPTEREYAQLHTFKFKVPVGRHLYVHLERGLSSFGGYKLPKVYDQILQVPEYPREVRFLHDGALLSLNGEQKISVLARNLPGIRFEVARILPGTLNHLVSQTSGDFKSPYFENYNFNEANLSRISHEVIPLATDDPTKTQYAALDLGRYLRGGDKRLGVFIVRAQGYDPQRKVTQGPEDRRLVLLTDLGVLVKDNADKSHEVFVQSIKTGLPVAGAQVSVLGRNGLPIASQITSAQGRATLPDLDKFSRDKAPTVYVVRQGGDVSFLPFGRYDRRLNFSRFDTGGVRGTTRAGRLGAYLFSDRGIYRPGDAFNVGLIVKASDWQRSVAGIPLEVAISDPRGLQIHKRRIKLDPSGFQEIGYRTEATAPTGHYEVAVYVVKDGRRHSLLGSAQVRVEEFLPDRMKITTRLSAERFEGWVHPDALEGRVTLKNLFGTPATDRRIVGTLNLRPAFFGFRKYPDHAFHDPQRAKRSYHEALGEKQTDENGEATFPLELDRFDRATYRLTFSAEGFEAEGGRSVTAQRSVVVSTRPFLVGAKPDGSLRYINKGSDRSVSLLAVGPDLKGVAATDLRARIIEEKYVSVLLEQDDGTLAYQSVKREVLKKEHAIKIGKTGLTYQLPTTEPGDHVLVVVDKDGLELNRVAFSVVGEGNISQSLEKNAELQIKLDKADYAAGDTVQIQIRGPYHGAGVITVERDRVYAHKFFKTDTTSTVQTIQVPPDLEGNGYINVSFVRAMDSREIFMSPLSYGVAPFSISKASRTVDIDLQTPELTKPGETLSIRYKGSRKGKAVIFAVDEGILQVARYKTPDPLAHFFQKRALEVGTYQILDLLLPEYSLIRELSAPGGGGAEEALARNLNPFQRKVKAPVAFWSGIVDIDTTEKEVTYQVPDHFNGSLRVMAVAVSPQAVGANEKKVLVRGPFVLSPNAPTFVAPGDSFAVSVSVANNIEGSGDNTKVQLKLAPSKHLKMPRESSQEVVIGEGREKSATFFVTANDELGAAELRFVARAKNEKGKATAELSVRPPVPYMTRVQSGHVKDGKKEVALERSLYPHFRVLEASVSHLPLALAHGLVQYLRRYPYGCTEQLVSQAMPALVLADRPAFGIDEKEAQRSLHGALQILQARQNRDGAFGFWAANSHVSPWQTVYAAHFLTEAKLRGIAFPRGVLDRAVGYLKGLARKNEPGLANVRTRAYAIYVLARNGIVPTRELGDLMRVLEGDKKGAWKKDSAAAFLAGTYAILHKREEAERLIRPLKLEDAIKADYQHFYDDLLRDAHLLFIWSMHFPRRLADLDGASLLKITEPVARGSYNSISSATLILALDAFASAVGYPATARKKESALPTRISGKLDAFSKPGLDRVTLSQRFSPEQVSPLPLEAALFPSTNLSEKAKAVVVENQKDNVLFYQITEGGFDRTPAKKEIKDGVEIVREYRKVGGDAVSEVGLGEELEVHLTVRTVDGASQWHLAYVDLLPGGFEVVQNRGQGAQRLAHGSSTLEAQHIDIREDRVVVYGGAQGSARKFIYRIKATNKGEYTVPPPFVESMYDRGIQGRGLSARLVVR